MAFSCLHAWNCADNHTPMSPRRFTRDNDGSLATPGPRTYDRVMASSRRSPDPLRVAAAKIAGVTQRWLAGGISDDQALVEVGAALGTVAVVVWPRVLA